MEFAQNTPEWLAWRRKKIGASDAPIIMGFSPWKTPYQLWVEKVTGAVPSANAWQQRGLDLEGVAREAFEKKTGLKMVPKVQMHPTLEWMMASLDGINEEGSAIVEIKCAGPADHAVALAGEIPKKYYPQLQHQLAVTGLEMVYYYSYNGYNNALLEVSRNNAFIANMISQEQQFWECIEKVKAPAQQERDVAIRKDEAWETASQKWLAIHRQMKELEAQEKEARATLIQLANNQNVAGNDLRLSRMVRKGNVQYAQIPELRGVDLDKYRAEPMAIWYLKAKNKPQ